MILYWKKKKFVQKILLRFAENARYAKSNQVYTRLKQENELRQDIYNENFQPARNEAHQSSLCVCKIAFPSLQLTITQTNNYY